MKPGEATPTTELLYQCRNTGMVCYQNSNVATANQVLKASKKGGYNLSRQPAPLLDCPHSEKVSPHIQQELLSFPLVHPPIMHFQQLRFIFLDDLLLCVRKLLLGVLKTSSC